MKSDFKVAIKAPFAPTMQRGKPHGTKSRAAEPMPSRPPRIAVLMALAIHMEKLLRDGHVKDQVELAALAGVTRARVTQVMNLLGLAPAIQEALLFLRAPSLGSDLVIERAVRELSTDPEWERQRRRFP